MRTSVLVGLLGITIGLAAGLMLRARPSRVGRVTTVFTSTGSTVVQVEELCKLVSAKVYIADVLIAEDGAYRGSWLIKGDALLAVDAGRAQVKSVDEKSKTAVVALPPPHVLQARVDHDKTKTWAVEKRHWVPGFQLWRELMDGVDYNPDIIRDNAMAHGQHLVHKAASDSENMHRARESAEKIVVNFYKQMGWTVTVEWQQ